MSSRTAVKNAVLRGLELGGAHRLAAGYRRNHLLVPCYHGVISDPPQPPPGGYRYDAVAASDFARQLDALSRWYRFVDLHGAIKWMENGPSGDRPAALITFDDGYRNNLTIAAPLLKKRGIPAVFFLTTNYIGTDRLLWPTELLARIEHSTGAQVPLPGDATTAVIPAENAARRALAQRILVACKKLPNAERLAYLEQLRSATELDRERIDRELCAFMSWHEARELAGMGFDLGSHTMEHPILSSLSPEEIRAELAGSKARLESESGRAVKALAYPNGGTDDFNESVIAEATRAGYSHSFAVGDTFQSSNASAMAIRRMIIPGFAPPFLFSFITSGCRDLLSRKKL